VDAHELLRGDAPFVADTSVWWRAAILERCQDFQTAAS
jgi:hypothetical protein